MSRAISYHQFHPLPRFYNMVMINLLKIHYKFPREMILAVRKYLEIKAFLHLFHELILYLVKDEKQVLA